MRDESSSNVTCPGQSADAPTGELPVALTRDLTRASIVLIEPRSLVRECLSLCLSQASGQSVFGFANVEDWLQSSRARCASLVVVSAGNGAGHDTDRVIARLAQAVGHLPTILLSDENDPAQIADALAKGVRGFIPTSVPLDVAVAALRLVTAGGTFIPATCLFQARRRNEAAAARVSDVEENKLTPRQSAVLEALRKGKPNKIIAYELNMQESTVKVHVRAIMKKMNARNRTEVAFMTNVVLPAARLAERAARDTAERNIDVNASARLADIAA